MAGFEFFKARAIKITKIEIIIPKADKTNGKETAIQREISTGTAASENTFGRSTASIVKAMAIAETMAATIDS